MLVAEASNGREALTVLETERIDAVFTDLNMPVMSGTELLREMATLGCETCSTLAHPQVRLGGLPAPEEDTIVLSVNGRPTVLRAEFE